MEDRRTIPGAIVEAIYLLVIGLLTYKQSLPPVWCGGLLLGYAIKSGFIALTKQHAKVVNGLTGLDLSGFADGPSSSISQRLRALRPPPRDNDPPPPSPDQRTREMPATRDPSRESRPNHDDPRAEPRGDWKPPRQYRHRVLAALRRLHGWGRPALPALLLLVFVTLESRYGRFFPRS